MDFPTELWKEISLYLPYNYLAVNKSLLQLYNENWCQNKVLSKYPNCKKHNNTWETLYKRSLKSGNIMLYHSDGNIINYNCPKECFKTTSKNVYRRLILTFDGDLFSYEKDNNQFTLLDENVTDISGYIYIKNNELYDYEFDKKLVIRSEEKFIALVISDEEEYAAITNNKFYYYCEYNDISLSIENKNNIKLI